jgi:hypothetical protein
MNIKGFFQASEKYQFIIEDHNLIVFDENMNKIMKLYIDYNACDYRIVDGYIIIQLLNKLHYLIDAGKKTIKKIYSGGNDMRILAISPNKEYFIAHNNTKRYYILLHNMNEHRIIYSEKNYIKPVFFDNEYFAILSSSKTNKRLSRFHILQSIYDDELTLQCIDSIPIDGINKCGKIKGNIENTYIISDINGNGHSKVIVHVNSDGICNHDQAMFINENCSIYRVNGSLLFHSHKEEKFYYKIQYPVELTTLGYDIIDFYYNWLILENTSYISVMNIKDRRGIRVLPIEKSTDTCFVSSKYIFITLQGRNLQRKILDKRLLLRNEIIMQMLKPCRYKDDITNIDGVKSSSLLRFANNYLYDKNVLGVIMEFIPNILKEV